MYSLLILYAVGLLVLAWVGSTHPGERLERLEIDRVSRRILPLISLGSPQP